MGAVSLRVRGVRCCAVWGHTNESLTYRRPSAHRAPFQGLWFPVAGLSSLLPQQTCYHDGKGSVCGVGLLFF